MVLYIAERKALLFTFLLTLIMAACSSSRQLEPVELEDFEEEAKFKTLWSTKVSGGQGDYFHQFRLQQGLCFFRTQSSYKRSLGRLLESPGRDRLYQPGV